MAKIFENKKGFKIIETSMLEMNRVYGIAPICDYCNGGTFVGYLISVLNQWYCKECFDRWYLDAINHPEDRDYENHKFNEYSKYFL